MDSSDVCTHDNLIDDLTPFSETAGFKRESWGRRLACATPSSRSFTASQLVDAVPENTIAKTYPAPLILQDDELALDPKCPQQSLRAFIQLADRNHIDKQRHIIYVAGPPVIDDKVSFVGPWCVPSNVKSPELKHLWPPKLEDVKEYLSAFYHGLEVVTLPAPVRLIPWDENMKPPRKGAPKKVLEIGLQIGDSATRVRARPVSGGIFPYQLNLCDILDAVMEAVPEDAYAVMVLFNHDLWEDYDDDFCCGRAFGGDRVCALSTARYHPGLDDSIGIDRAHAWPASHCKAYLSSMLGPDAASWPREHLGADESPGPLRAAVDATKAASDSDLYGLWLSRICRTASHELGHCLGLEHCVYFACVMQSAAHLAEDARQPMYLCPICMAKLSRAIVWEFRGKRNDTAHTAYTQERDEALLAVCERRQTVRTFAGLGAWIDAQK